MNLFLAFTALAGCAVALEQVSLNASVFRASFDPNVADNIKCDGSEWSLASIVPTIDPESGPLPVFKCGFKEPKFAICRHTHNTDNNNITRHRACTRFTPSGAVLDRSFVLTHDGQLMWLTRNGFVESFPIPQKDDAIPEITRTRLTTSGRPGNAPTQSSGLFNFEDMIQVVPRIYRDPYYIIEYKSAPTATHQQHSYLVVNTRGYFVIFWDQESVSSRPAFLAADNHRVLIAREHDGASFYTWLIDWSDPAFFSPAGKSVGEYDWPMPYLLDSLPDRSSEGADTFRPRAFRPEHLSTSIPAALLSGDTLCQPSFRGGRAWMICINATIDSNQNEQFAAVLPARETHSWTKALTGIDRFQKPAGVSLYYGSVPRIEAGRAVFGGFVGSRRWIGGIQLNRNEVFTLSSAATGVITQSPTQKMSHIRADKDADISELAQSDPLHMKARALSGFQGHQKAHIRGIDDEDSEIKRIPTRRGSEIAPRLKVDPIQTKCLRRTPFDYLRPLFQRARPRHPQVVAQSASKNEIYGPQTRPKEDEVKKMQNKPGKKITVSDVYSDKNTKKRARFINQEAKATTKPRGFRRVLGWLAAPWKKFIFFVTRKDLTQQEYTSIILSLTLGLGMTILLVGMLCDMVRRELRARLLAKLEAERLSLAQMNECICRGDPLPQTYAAPSS